MGHTTTMCNLSSPRLRGTLGFLLALATTGIATNAHSDSNVIDKPGRHPRYRLEGEAHLLAGLIEGPAPDDDSGVGAGLRVSWEIVDNGFVPSINNTVAVGVGLDYMNWGQSTDLVDCVRQANGAQECREARYTYYELIVPVVAQWNFWFTRRWSAFAEPGIALRLRSHADDRFEPLVFFLGGRYKLADQALITARIGFPYTSVGFSWIY